jgi:hypothetical protein
MSASENSCRIEVLSRTPHCTVGYCAGCETFHVELGQICLKLHPLQLQALSGSLSEAVNAFTRQHARQTPSARPRRAPSIH